MQAAAGFVFVGGKTQLIIGDDMHSPAHLVAGNAREVERLRYDALARK